MKMKKTIKPKKSVTKNLSTIIVIAVAVLVLFGILFIKNTFFAGETKAIYGNRKSKITRKFKK